MAEKKEIKTKAKKEPKTVPNKKLPKILKKAYTKEALEKKLLKKIYIETDRKLIAGLFSSSEDKKGRKIMKIDLKSSLPKEQFVRCKVIAKDVQAQKGAVKLVPLFATVCFLVAIGVTVTLFKNVVVKKVIKSGMQDIFQARTDIERVDFQIFGATLEVNGLEQANKDSPMKNLFQIDKIQVDFNLTDLLRGKLHANNIEVSGVALDTDRKVSGELYKKSIVAKAVESEVKVIEKNSESLGESAKEKLVEMFADYNPEKMLSNLQNELKSPALAQKVSSEVKEKVTKWQNVPSEYNESVKRLSSSVNSLVKTDWGNITDLPKLKQALVDINTAYTESQSLQKKINTTTSEISKDSAFVSNCSNDLKNAVKADTALVDSKIAEMKATFSPQGLKSIMNEAVQSMVYKMAGKYYPYVAKAMDAAMSSKGSGGAKKSGEKSSGKEKKAKKEKPVMAKTHARSKGRTIYYKKDTVPKLLIENVKASGYEYNSKNLLFEGTAQEISSDQNIRGKPCTINADFNVLGKPNKANVVVDSRETSTAKLVTADYSGKGYPVSADAGVFTVSSNSDINARLLADKDGTFVIGGTLDMNVKEMSGMEFEPAKVSSLYNSAVKKVSKLTIGFNIGYDGENGIVVEITNMDKLSKQLITPVTQALTGELNTIANDAKKNVTKTLSEKTGIATEQIDKFTDIQGLLNGQATSVKDLQKQLDNKKAEIQKQIEKQAAGAIKDATKGLLNKLF